MDCFGAFFCFLAYGFSSFLGLSADCLGSLLGFVSDGFSGLFCFLSNSLGGFFGFLACGFKSVLDCLVLLFLLRALRLLLRLPGRRRREPRPLPR